MKVSVWQLYLFNARLGIAPFLGGVPYPRFVEYPLAIQMARSLDDCRILDIGSGRRGRFPLFLLSLVKGAEIHSTDIVDYSDEQYRRARKLGYGEAIGTGFVVQQQDATQLTYDSGYFDRVFAISTLEHIPGDGDSEAMSEIARVLSPDGLAIIAVPFRALGYDEEFRRVDVSFHRHPEGVFYERRYDLAAIRKRLLSAARLRAMSICFYGEAGLPFWSGFYKKILPKPMYLQWMTLPFRVAMPLLSAQFLSVLRIREIRSAMGIVFAVQRR